MLPKDKLKEIVDYHVQQIRRVTDFVPDIALVLGSGLGALADEVDTEAVVNYNELHRFPVSTVPGHEGRFVFGRLGGVKVVIMQGRVHYYEGYNIQEVVMPIRVMVGLGARVLYLTNASGGINPEFSAGDLMLITDQIAMFVPSPLVGENVDEWGTRFPSMNQIYDENLSRLIEQTASENGIDLKKGVYLQTTGPQYESPAEVQMIRSLGGDAVGMSTAVEAITAVHMGLKVCGVSCITNMAGGTTAQAITHDEVKETADRVADMFKKLITGSIVKIANEE
ncbi:MAG: purine-nucleoside phosphorylase [Eubacterium sp.]|nr:purine-nucleoside phosphorylase [Eubacterium sp.]